MSFVSFLLSCHFSDNLFSIIQLIRSIGINVGGKLIKALHYRVPLMTFVMPADIALVQQSFKKRIQSDFFLFSTPRFLYVDYRLFFAYLIRKPLVNDLVYPIALDIYRITGYY